MAVPDDDSRIWTAAELYRLTPAECDAVIRRRHQKTLTFEDVDPAFASRSATGRRPSRPISGGRTTTRTADPAEPALTGTPGWD
jgi:hypothetical protein